MSYLYRILRLFSLKEKPLIQRNASEKAQESCFDNLNKFYEKDGMQFDIYGNPYINDVFYLG